MEILTNGWNRKCKNSLGGLSKIWLMPYVKYSRSQIVVNGNILTSFPQTLIYEFYSNGSPNFSETNEQDNGGKFYSQSIDLELNKVHNIEKLLKKDFRIITKDNNGIYRILGLYKGLEAESLNYKSGGGKSEFNGYSISFTGKEEKPSFFIDDLEDTGFFNGEFNYRITQTGEFRITQDNKYRILE